MKLTKFLFVTGDRAEYDLLFPVISAISAAADMEVSIAVCGSHLIPRFGYSMSEIENDGFNVVARIDNLLASGNPVSRAKSLAIEVCGISDAILQTRPDFIVILGDREDGLAAAVVGVYAQIPVIHFGGGDCADDGNSDNPVRDAISKLSNIHFTASEKSRNRLISIGEEPWRCHNVGATGLDRLRQTPLLSRSKLWKRIGTDPIDGAYAVLIQHPLLPEYKQAEAQLIETLEAMLEIGIPVFISRPNSDPGNAPMHDTIRRYEGLSKNIRPFTNLPRLEFVNLLRNASVLVGNSSAGIIEAPYLKLPAVNVGRRQLGREHASNVVFVDYDKKEIAKAVRESLQNQKRLKQVRNCDCPYGDGHAATKALEMIRALMGDRKKLLHKRQGEGL